MTRHYMVLYGTVEALFGLSGAWFLATINWSLYQHFHNLMTLGLVNAILAGLGLLKGPAGALGDRGQRRLFIGLSLWTRTGAAMLALLDRDLASLLCAIGIYAIAQTVFRPNLTASLNEQVPDVQRTFQNQRLLGIQVLSRGMGLVAFMVSPVGQAANNYALGTLMAAVAVLAVFLPTVHHKITQPNTRHRAVDLTGLGALRQIDLVYWSLPGYALLNCGMALVTGSLPALTVTMLHGDHLVYGLLMAASLAAMTLGTLWGNCWASLSTQRRLYGSLAAIPVVYGAWIIEAHLWMAFAALTVLAAIGGQLSALIVAYEQHRVDSRYRGAVTGITSGVTGAMGGAGSLTLVFVSGWPLVHMQMLIAAIFGAAFLVLVGAFRRFYRSVGINPNRKEMQSSAGVGL